MAEVGRRTKAGDPCVLFLVSMVRFSRVSFQVVVGLIVFATFVFLVARGRPGARQGAVEPVLVTAGLHQPRGLDIAPDGTLYVLSLIHI